MLITPNVSIIVPIYGVEKYIKRCAESLFNQTFNNIEYLFINDCTQDNSIEILNEVLAAYPERKQTTKIVNMPVNSGLPAVRKQGVKLATGNYIIHCDSDDWMEPEMIAELYTKAVNENLDIVFCDYYRSFNDSKTVFKNKTIDGKSKDEYFRDLLTRRCFTSVWNKLVRRSIFTENKIEYPVCNMWEDYVICSQAFVYSTKIGYVNKPLYNYYCNTNSICFDRPDRKLEQISKNASIILSFISKCGLTNKYKNEIVCFKNTAREELLIFLGEKKYKNMWLNTFSEINTQYLTNSIIPIKDKIRFIFIILNIYPFLLKYKTDKYNKLRTL